MLKAARSGSVPGSVRDTNKTRQYQNMIYSGIFFFFHLF